METARFSQIFGLVAISLIATCGSVAAQGHFTITANSAGMIKLGMTVSQARKAMNGFRFARSTDGEGVALIDVVDGRKIHMTLYAGEPSPDRKIDERAKIEQIWVWDARYRTASGMHPGMSVKNAERILGRLKRISMSEIESRQYVEFLRQPKGLEFRIVGGDFPSKKRETLKYESEASIICIDVTGSWD